MNVARKLLKKFNNEKTLPHVAIRLSKLISDENSPIQEFQKIIKMDPTLVLRLLRLVNSSYYGLRKKVDSISRAVIFVGMKNLRNMVVTEALKDIFAANSSQDVFSRRQLWLHCAAVSVCSQMISERIFEQEGEDAYLCGILHDIGMIVEDQVEHDLFLQVCTAHTPEEKTFAEYEREIIGTDHCRIGYLLASEWKLPVDVQDGIKQHHLVSGKLQPSSIPGITQIAEYLVSKMNYSALPGMKSILSPPLAAHIKNNLEEYKVIIKDLPEEMSKAKDLYEPHEA
jgi:HD-like signal output (HDOD) protein